MGVRIHQHLTTFRFTLVACGFALVACSFFGSGGVPGAAGSFNERTERRAQETAELEADDDDDGDGDDDGDQGGEHAPMQTVPG